MSKKRIGEILALFCEMYNKELSKELTRIYIDRFLRFPIEKIESAANQLMDNHALSRFPTIADFMKYLKPSDEEEKLNARTAWNTALRKMELEGSFYTVKFDDRNIHFAIISLGGWIEFINKLKVTSPENLVFVEKDFIEAYLACKHTIPKETPIPKLVGRIELANTQKGYLKDGVLTLPGGQAKQISFKEGGLDDEIKTITEGQKRTALPELSKTDE